MTTRNDDAQPKKRVASVRPARLVHAEPTPSHITARPKTLADELGGLEREDEEGLSVSPEQLGSQFLEDAIEEGDSRPSLDERAELDINAGARSDQAFSGPTFDPDEDVWENTVNFTLQEGTDASFEALEPGSAAVEQDDPEPDDLLDLSAEERDLDLTQDSVHEASLFDHETGELGEVESPDLITDDAHTHERLRGGHSFRGARRRPSAE